MPPNGNAGQNEKERVGEREKERVGEREKESRGESVTNVTYHYYQCNLSYYYHSNAYKLMNFRKYVEAQVHQ